ncbi:YbaB/EbfC family nucleoid-associated protein [Micromonospora orduensis]|uniref:YbaB/EbfC family nucleoid-associated protein n=1 Tax=Micromonospora orduensis TaxID=1420891 RepID=A0A5C4QGR9_9ACTN|nr:YbaB/EbfC family nucleoid-associated protein [Micromonospora orduensis]TNH24925.1 YbaB/EbfC family nucleoid-associated protein [Micromonospora orduensis]
MWADDAALDAADRRLDEWETSLAEQASRATTLSTRLRAITGTATSPDGAVEVTVDSNGLLADLRLDERIRQQSATRTARQITDTTRVAHADLLKRLTGTTVEILGAGDPTGQAIIDSYRRRLDPTEDEPHARR